MTVVPATIAADRSLRVSVLLIVILLLSIVDLVLTVHYLTTWGLAESNPIAAWLIRGTRSVPALALYKAMTVTVAVGCLYAARRHRLGEWASWGAVVILLALCWRWSAYADIVATMPEPTSLAVSPFDVDVLRLDGS